jgi:hypothetical protein
MPTLLATYEDADLRTKNGDQRRVNGSLKFLSKLSTAVPKSIPKRHTNKSYKNMSHQESRDPREVP